MGQHDLLSLSAALPPSSTARRATPYVRIASCMLYTVRIIVALKRTPTSQPVAFLSPPAAQSMYNAHEHAVATVVVISDAVQVLVRNGGRRKAYDKICLVVRFTSPLTRVTLRSSAFPPAAAVSCDERRWWWPGSRASVVLIALLLYYTCINNVVLCC